jgi:hypothetical protein
MHGSLLAAYKAMGESHYPTSQQIAKLRRSAEIPPPDNEQLKDGKLSFVLPPYALALIEFR